MDIRVVNTNLEALGLLLLLQLDVCIVGTLLGCTEGQVGAWSPCRFAGYAWLETIALECCEIGRC